MTLSELFLRLRDTAPTRLRELAASGWFSGSIVGLIVVNAIILGLETYPGIRAEYGPALSAADKSILWIFVAELALRLGGTGRAFFR
jgi:voltage-gated sodium channel